MKSHGKIFLYFFCKFMVSYFILLRNTFIMFLFASKEWPPHDMHRKRPVTRSFSIHLLSNYTRAKWHKRKPCHLEKLLSKWNSNYRNAPNATNYQVSKCHFPAKKYNPYKIYQKRKHAISIHDFFSKRPECQRCKFKALQAYRNSNNCNTPYASCKNPSQAAQ